MGFSRQEHRSGLPFPSPVDHILSELFTMTHLSWVALHGMVHSFIEIERLWSMRLDWLVFYDCDFCLSAVWCPLSLPTDLLVFLRPWTWAISSRPCSWPWTWSISSRPLATPAPHSHHLLPVPRNNTQLWMWPVMEARSDAVKSYIA